jgi:hypothetical protein
VPHVSVRYLLRVDVPSAMTRGADGEEGAPRRVAQDTKLVIVPLRFAHETVRTVKVNIERAISRLS